jgi:sarcosine oxidase subunit beta
VTVARGTFKPSRGDVASVHVVIVGGGVVGLATAHALSTADADVTLFERAALGSGSTERANGGIRAQFSTAENVKLSLRSLEVWESFEDRFGVDLDFRQHGYLFLTTEADVADTFAENVRLQNDLGVPSEYLGPDEVRERTDLRRNSEVVAGTYCPRDGYADPHSAVRGFADAARAKGVSIRTNMPVTDLERTGDAWRVRATSGPVDADAVVIAAGPWSPRVAAFAGVTLPVTPVRRQLALVEPEKDVPPAHPYTYHTERSVSFRPERPGTTIVSATAAGSGEVVDAPDDYATAVDRDFSIHALERLNAFSAYFGPGSRPTGGWAGLYSVTPDHNPIIDEPRPGLHVATGFSGHGFMHAPAVGEHLRAALTGEASVVDATPYRLDRFDTDGDGEQLVL